MKVGVIGTGYVGLVTGTCLADSGNEVICTDIDQEKIDKLNNGICPIYEEGLEELIKRNYKSGRLKFTTNTKKTIQNSLVNFIAVGTPQKENGETDLSQVLDVADIIGDALKTYRKKDYKIIVVKSTVPPGTNKLVGAIIRMVSQKDFGMASNPEFLKEGTAVNDFQKPDRIVIGAKDKKVFETLKKLYAPFVKTGKPILEMKIESAEAVKYGVNGLLATKISYMNEYANFCELIDADIDEVRKGIGSDPRIGPQFLFPGIGYGGSCFPKDIKSIINEAKKRGYDLKILNSVNEVNEKQKEILINKIRGHYHGPDLTGKQFAIWGLSFKPKTDDMREAPSINIINKLLSSGCVDINAYDPEALENARKIFGHKIYYFDDSFKALKNSDALIICTEWNEFRNPDFKKIKKYLKEPVIFDGRNVYDPKQMKDLGFRYYSIGR